MYRVRQIFPEFPEKGMAMNVLFVYSLDNGILPDGLLSSQELIQFGISHISSFLKKQGHCTELFVTSWLFGQRAFRDLKRTIDAFRPGVICFSAIATQYDFISGLATYVKGAYPDIYFVIGGVHATLNPEEAASGDFDAICVGEGEGPVAELVAQLEAGKTPSGVPNLWIKHDSGLEKNSPRFFMQDLDSLPFPDRDMWQRWMSNKSPRMCSVLASRGCPFDCSYCSNHALQKITQGSYVRHRSPENIIEEIMRIVVEFPTTKEIYLETETLIINRPWCLALCAGLEKLNKGLKDPLSFGANIRIVPRQELESIFSAMKSCNFRFINIGLESGSERVRREILRRNYSNDDVTHAVASARKHGLQVALFNLIGVPGETFDDFKETVRINRLCKPDWNLTSIYFPYNGTDLYRSCKERGLLKESIDHKNERQKAVLDLPGFSKSQIRESLKFFNYYVYKGLNPEDRFRASLLYFWNITIKRFHKRILRSLKMRAHNISLR
jgi:radical SAM superfamily enzyme YgiQ (UPF0313 family)